MSVFTRHLLVGCLAIGAAFAGPVAALESLDFTVKNASKSLDASLRAASVLLAAKKAGNTDAEDVFSDARAEYSSLLAALYAAGHYSAVIHVRIDGVEAADIAPLDAPSSVRKVVVSVDPGPAFVFSQAQIKPLAKRTVLPEAFAKGRRAKSETVLEAVGASIDAWRKQGHAAAAVANQNLEADHPAHTLAVDVTLDVGPKLRFGPLAVQGHKRMRLARILKIAGFPEGDTFDPEDIKRAAARLRRTGVFSSVSLREDDTITAPDLIGVTATLVEQKTRHLSFGIEAATDTGITLTGGWMHRNLNGGAERLSLDAGLTNIGLGRDAFDWNTGIKFERPATFTPDTTFSIGVETGQQRQEDVRIDLVSGSVNLKHIFTDKLNGDLGLAYDFARVVDPTDVYVYRSLSFPIGVTWDNRNSKTDAARGIYMQAQAKPFLGFGVTDSGVRLELDARGYKGFGPDDGLILAGRLQLGAVLGSTLLGTPRDDLFFSGGGGTVRGQPYQSLGVNVLRDNTGTAYATGGTHFVAASIEARTRITEKFGLVGFVDAGRVGVLDFAAANGDWHAGAGVGVRYATAVGPIRLDVAVPVAGTTGDGPQVYLGLGQAF